jgi:hypothetical protein
MSRPLLALAMRVYSHETTRNVARDTRRFSYLVSCATSLSGGGALAPIPAALLRLSALGFEGTDYGNSSIMVSDG